jgi:16S rRNA (guanine527-N7)-methyltransferase
MSDVPQSPDAPSLSAALEQLELQLPPDQLASIDHYRSLLWAWNEKLNLTRHTRFDAFAGRDVVDSLQLAQLLQSGEEVLDVGSGGGVPGVLLALLRPDLEVHLCESVGKRARVLDDIVRELGLSTPIHACRAEAVVGDLRFDSVVARAVGPLWKICTWFEPHRASMKRLLLIKGPRWTEERAAARERGLLQRWQLRRVAEYPLWGTFSHSVILQLSRS